MTEAYDWRAMPYKLEVTCPKCSSCAVFDFSEIIKIAQKKDVEYFSKSKIFEYRQFQDFCGHKWHAAIFYHGLHSLANISDLPQGYSVDDFKHSKYSRQFPPFGLGAIICTKCMLRQKASLDWPKDAFYQCEFKGRSLWAFNRESLVDLKNFIASDTRQTGDYKYSGFLLHIPSIFLDRKNRGAVVKKLDKLLFGEARR